MVNLQLIPKWLSRQPSYAPQIAWNNPYTVGLIGAITPTASIELVTRKPLTIVSSFATTPTAKGAGLLGNNLRYVYGTLPTYTGDAWTFLMVGGFATTGTRIRGGLGDTGTNRIFAFQQNGATASRAFIRFTNAGSSTITNFTAPNTSTAQDVFVMKALNATTLSVYYNGVNASSVLTTTSTGTPSFNTIGLGGARNNTDNIGATGQESTLVLGWNRALSDTEIFFISRNPWQVFRSAPNSLHLSSNLWYGLASMGVGG